MRGMHYTKGMKARIGSLSVFVAALMLSAASGALAAQGKATTRPAAAAGGKSPTTRAATSAPVRVDVSDKDAVEAAVDHDAVVVGTVASARWTASGKTLIIKFADAPMDFRAISYEKARASLDNAFDGDVAKNIVGKKVEITGHIKKYSGSVQNWQGLTDLAINRAGQVKVLEEAKK